MSVIAITIVYLNFIFINIGVDVYKKAEAEKIKSEHTIESIEKQNLEKN